MNRFDSEFNGIDTETSRPFSSGHPDGVWFVSIIYGLILLGSFLAILYVLFSLLFGAGFHPQVLLHSILNFAMFAPVIYLLFKRDKLVLKLCVGLIVFFIVTSIFAGAFKQPEAAIFGVYAVIQVFVFIYLLGIRRDKLLN